MTLSVGIGAYKIIISRLVADVKAHAQDMQKFKEYFENKLIDAEKDNEIVYVHKDVYNQCMLDIQRRLDAFDALEIGSQLAEIKAMLIALKEQLKQK